MSENPITEPWGAVEDAYRWIEAKGLPVQKLGKLWKLKLSEVDSWVRAGGWNEGMIPKNLLPLIGTICVETCEEKGTRFVIGLPRRST